MRETEQAPTAAPPDATLIRAAALRRAGFTAIRRDAHPFTAETIDPEAFGGYLAALIRQYLGGLDDIDQDEDDAWFADLKALDASGAYSFAVLQFCLTATRPAIPNREPRRVAAGGLARRPSASDPELVVLVRVRLLSTRRLDATGRGAIRQRGADWAAAMPRRAAARSLADQSCSEGIIGARRADISADHFEDELAVVSSEHVASPVTCSVGNRDPGDQSRIEVREEGHTGMEVTQDHAQVAPRTRHRHPAAACVA